MSLSLLIGITTGAIGLLSQMVPSTGTMFRETPPSYNFSWHNAPRRQYIVNLDADVEITVSSGETKVIRQGEVFFVEDTHGELHVYIVDCDTVMLFRARQVF